MGEFQTMWLSQEDMIFNRLVSFHRQRVESLLGGSPPLYEPENGFIVVHLIPQECVGGRSRFTGSELKAHGSQMPALGQRIGYSHRFNTDGLIDRYGSDPPRAYSQLFRDGRLESAMTDLVYKQYGASIIRVTSCEMAVFQVVEEYQKFCRGIALSPPVWLFAALVNCGGARAPLNPRFNDVSETAIDRPVAYLPEIVIPSFDSKVAQSLRPFCDSIWQAAGVERSLNYDKDGNWHEPR